MHKNLLTKKYSVFFESENYICASTEMQKNIYSLFEEFFKIGFEIYPVWREKHKTNKYRVFVFKTSNFNAKNGESNVITVYPNETNLKVEIYYNEFKKNYYNYSFNNDNTALLQEVKYYYENVLDKSLRNPDFIIEPINVAIPQTGANEMLYVKEIEIIDCPFEIDSIVTHKGRENPKAKITSKNSKYFEVVWEQSKKMSKYANEDALKWFYAE